MDVKPPPAGITDVLAPAWVWVLSFIGAAVGYLEDFCLQDDWKTWLLKALTKSSSSALAAVLTFRALMAMDVDPKWHVIVVGVSAHMGVEALKAMGEAWKSRLPK